MSATAQGFPQGAAQGCIYLTLGRDMYDAWMDDTVRPIVTQRGTRQLAQYSQQCALEKKEQPSRTVTDMHQMQHISMWLWTSYLCIVILGIGWIRWVYMIAGKEAESGGQQAGEVVEEHFQQCDQQPEPQLC